ncbi:MAG: (4Fe-4S)-binding protein [Flavobacteriales bacterium]|nr:(4Fe-4S)-binding protein [Flavobacteriales bacterium]
MDAYDNDYSNADITVTYDPKICKQSELCAKGLSEVFLTTVIPWIDLDGADTEKIIAQVKKCPSGALQYHNHTEKVTR